MTDWISALSCRKSHTIESAYGAGSGYQVRIHVHYGAGIDNDEDVYLNGLCRHDFGDIRFMDVDGKSQLPYWMESKTGGKDAVFWVRIAGSLDYDSKTIYIYYNDWIATTTSNGDDTFIFCDHFEGSAIDTDKWEVLNPNQFTLNDDSWVNCTGYTSSLPVLKSIDAMQTRDVAIEAKLDVLEASGDSMLAGWRANFLSNEDGCYWYSEGDADRVVVSNGSPSWQNGETVSMTTGNVRSNVYITDGKIRWKTEGARNFDETFENPTNDANRRLKCFASNTNYNVKCDFIFVRKYVENEPAHGSWGTLEINSTIVVGNSALVTGYASKATTINSPYDPVLKVIPTTAMATQTPLIQNLIIEGEGDNGGIMVEDVYGCQIRNVSVKDCETGIMLRNTNIWTEGSNITHVRMSDVKYGIKFDVNRYGARSFAYPYIEDVCIELKNEANCTGIVIGPGSKPYCSFIKATVWIKNATNNKGMHIQGLGADFDGQIRGGLVSLYVSKLGTTGGTGVLIETEEYTAVQCNQSFLLAAHNLSTNKYNNHEEQQGENADDIDELTV